MEGISIIFVIIPLFIAVFIIAAIYSHKKEKERQEAMRMWAERHGLRFSAERVRGFDRQYSQFDCLRRGSNRYAHNIISGNLGGLESTLFDYHYETKSRNSKGNTTTHHHRFSAVMLVSPVVLRPLVVRPEGVFDKVTAAFGWDDIDFESAEFSRRYYVKCSDKRWAYDVIHGKIMEMLLKVKGYQFECDESVMICYGSAKRFSLEEFEGAYRLASTILKEIPGHATERILHHA